MADLDKFSEAFVATAPEKLRDMSDETLEAHHRYFVDILPDLLSRQAMYVSATGRLTLLRDEIRSRAVAKQSRLQHAQAIRIGKQTLF